MVNRVYYINLNYMCDNKCIFCYSHNTNHLHNSTFTLKKLQFLFDKYNISKDDRVILNGGEPLLHKEIDKILTFLYHKGVEVLIFTNGRNIKNLNPSTLNENIRFIVPVHGDKDIHNYITRDEKSFDETMKSLEWLTDNKIPCLVDIKIILNEKTIEESGFKKSLEIWKKIPFNNAIHITKMMETKVSKVNKCKELDEKKINKYNLELFKEFRGSRKLKFYSTCINGILDLGDYEVVKNEFVVKLLYIDYQSEKYIDLKRKDKRCGLMCKERNLCLSEVDEYSVLEFYKDRLYKNME